MWLDFCMQSPLYDTRTQLVAWSDCLVFFCSTQSVNRHFLFDIQLFWNFIQWLPCAFIIFVFKCSDIHWTVVSNPFRSGDHDYSKDVLILLLVIIFSRIFVQYLKNSKHLCSYSALLLNYLSIPMVNICCLSLYDSNNPLRMTHYYSNDSMEIMVSTTFIKSLDLAHYVVWALLPPVLKQR